MRILTTKMMGRACSCWMLNLLVHHKQITNRQEHQTHADDIHMRSHIA